MNHSRSFQPVCSQLEERIVLSGASDSPATAFAIVELPLAKSTTLKLSGVSPYGFLAHRGESVGAPITYVGLGGHAQKLTANGVKVPNAASNRVLPVTGDVVARLGAHNIQFYGPATLTLTTSKGSLTLALNPASPGSTVLNFSVASGTGVFAHSHGTGTITFGKLAVFHSNK